MDKALSSVVKNIVKNLYDIDASPVFEITAEIFGDLSTNIALQISSRVGKNPREIAQEIANEIINTPMIESADVAGPGFINVRFSDKAHALIVDEILSVGDQFGKTDKFKAKVVVAEYSDPNPFKILHAGHLYTSLIGDAIGSLFETAGAKVHRVNFGGDVGLHVGKSMWAILKKLGGELPEELDKISEPERLDWISARYVEGHEAYENDESSKAEIIEFNKKVYALHAQKDKSSPFAQIYWTCRRWSYDGFDSLYKKLDMVPFEKYYPESDTTPIGMQAVSEGVVNGIFEESEGAVVYKGEKDGLHTRVFVTSEGLPTYETKDLGLAIAKWNEYEFDKNVMITGNDIIEYMKVVQSALKNIHPEITERSTHLTHGIVKLTGGVKMSSRKGNILRADDILNSAVEAYKKVTDSENWDAVLAAVKYSFLKQRIGGDIIYNPEESVSITGSSGPYLQYAHARARSILSKVKIADSYSPVKSEIALLKKLQEYQGAVERSIDDMMPHHIATYLFELAQVFNSFYEKEKIVGSEREGEKARLVSAYSQVLKNGLNLLGIKAPEKM